MPSTSSLRLPRPRPGGLSKYGYHHIKTIGVLKRQAALRRAIRGEKLGYQRIKRLSPTTAQAKAYRSVIRYLLLLHNITSRTHLRVRQILRADQRYVSRLYKKYKSQ